MVIGISAAAVASLGNVTHVVSQKDRHFGPTEISLKVKEELRIVNDDGILVHHAYVDSPDFSYDSGDMDPGATAVIVFPNAGDFAVRCGIHPMMKLAVHVR